MNATRGLERPNLNVIPRVSSQQFEVAYELDTGTEPVGSVELWYTTDDGQSWHRYGPDADQASPMTFQASTEGLHGFYVVASNTYGVSSGPPDATTRPHAWVYVDYTPPAVQLHAVRQDDPPKVPQTLYVRWSAVDNGLAVRPISLDYRCRSDDTWQPIAGPIANSGAFDWRVPDTLTDGVEIRITVRDLGGHVVTATEPVHIHRPSAASQSSDPTSRMAGDSVGNGSPRVPHAEGETRERAFQLYQQGRLHTLRGEHRLAASRFRDALSVDPELADALVGLGRALYAQGESGESAAAFELALSQQPGSRDALEGLAMAYIGQRRFSDAVRQLSLIVQANDRDVEAWLNLGDIAVYQGDELLAREHYEKAMTLDPRATETIEKAKLRLADLRRLAAEFRQTRPPR